MTDCGNPHPKMYIASVSTSLIKYFSTSCLIKLMVLCRIFLMATLKASRPINRLVYLLGSSSLTSPKFWERPNILTSSEQQYFVWDTASQSTKRQDVLEVARHCPPGYGYVSYHAIKQPLPSHRVLDRFVESCYIKAEVPKLSLTMYPFSIAKGEHVAPKICDKMAE